jgi:hypothetical protein
MLNRIRRHASYANVMSTIAVFVVLGGGAYAAQKIGAGDIQKNAVRSKHIKKNAVRGSDVKSRQIAARHLKARAVTRSKLAAGAVGESALANDAATGSKVDEATLGTVPNADRVDGIDSAELLRGRGRTHAVRGVDEIGGSASAPMALDIGGNLTLTCNNPASVGSIFTFTNTSGATADVWIDKIQEGFPPPTTIDYQSVADDATATLNVSGPVVSSGEASFRFTISVPGRLTTVEARLAFGAPGACRFTALATELRT